MTSEANRLLFSQSELQAYKKISRDANPIHDTGLVFGILIMAKVEAILSARWDYQAITKYEYKFLKPLFVGERAQVKFYHDGEFEVWRENECIGKGVCIGR
jgi:NAD-dependent dihydropyrimidine dehydrogenase PreA subunit